MMFRTLAVLAVLATSIPATAINIVVDYTYSGSFFSTASTNGQKARATVEAAADYFSEILDDSFSRIETPDDYISTATGGSPATYSWNWEMRFNNPSTNSSVTLSNPVIAADEYRVYVGARNLDGSTLGLAGPGGWGSSQGGGWYFPSQKAEIDAISADFAADLENRDQAAGDFGAWGGVVAFDTPNNWNYDHLVQPTGGQNDLYSVALHEIGHALGAAASDEWTALRSGSQFLGEASRVANGGSYPTLTADGHWSEGTTSTVYGGTATQEAALDPTGNTGERKIWTVLDAAGMTDIGWEVVAPPSQAGDYNGDGLVNAVDYTVWRDNLGTPNATGTYNEWATNYGAGTATASSASVPEPAALLIVATGLIGVLTGRSSDR